MKRRVIGLVEKVKINGKTFKARIDTGAKMSSIDHTVGKKIKLGPVIRKTTILSVHGRSERPVVKEEIVLGGKKLKATFNLADRKEMKYHVLIGRNILRRGFLIDPRK